MDNYCTFIFKSVVSALKLNLFSLQPPPFKKYGVLLFLLFLFFGEARAQINRALHLSENSDYVEIPHNDGFNFTQNFTIGFWVKAELPQQSISTPYNTILIKSSGSLSGIPFGFQLINSGVDIGKVRVVRKNNNGNAITYVSTARIDDGRFHYLSLVRDSVGSVLRLYVDASLQGTQVSDITGTINNNSGIYLGRKGDGTENFQGSIDEIRIWRTARTQSNIQSDRNSSVVNIAGLVAYYNMETGLKNISTTTVAAQSVSGYAGGNVTYYPTQKHYGNALHFDGNNDLVSLAANPGVLTNQLALELWVRPDRLTGTQTLAGQAGKWALKLKDGKVNFTVYTTTSATLNVSSNLQLLSTGKWYHLAAVFNGNGVDNRMELFINGEVDNKITLPAAYSISTSGTGMLIGANGSVSASNEHFQGMMDEINLWKITRVADSVVLDMNRGVTYSSSNHLLYYRCDQGSPNGSNGSVSTMTNYIVGNTATLNNFTLSGNASNWVARAPYPDSPGANLLSGTTYNFQGSLSGQATGKILGQGFLTNAVTFPATYPDYTNNSITVIPSQGNNGSFEEDYTLPGGSFYYRSYVFGTEGTVLSDQSSGPCVTGFPIGNVVFTSGSVSLTASWTSVVNATGYDWVLTPSTGDFSTPEQSGTSQTPNVSLTKLDPGSRYYFYVRAKCGGGQGEWVGPAYFATLSSPILTASDLLNDAYVDAEWALPTAYFAQNAPLGVHLQLKSGNTLLYEQSITDYANYEGEPQPVFSYIGGGNTQQYSKVNNTASWPELTAWTMEAWLQTAATNTTSGILLRTVNGTDNFTIKLDSIRRVQLIVDANNTTQVYTFGYTQIPVEQWFHLAISYGNGGAALYINGASVAGLLVPAVSITGAEFQALYGANQTSMAELRFWNRIRSAEEIQYSRLTTAFTGVNQNALLLHWKWIISNASPSDMATDFDGLNNFAELYQIGGGIILGISNPGYIATPFYTAIRGSFRHILGPSLSKPYRLSGYQNGSGAIINAVYFPPLDSGKTLPYQAIQEVKADSTPFNVRITWKNKSKLSEYFRIRRTDSNGQNSVVLATISGTDRIDSVLTYVDAYQLADSNALKNGVVYRYYVDTYSGTFNRYFDTLKYNVVNLPPVTVTASDNTYPDKIILSWNDLSAFGYDIRINRDEETLTTLNPSEMTYTDNYPVFGKRHRYSVLLIDPVTNQPVAAGFDRGSIPSNGMIAGNVLTLEGSYAVKNVRIRLTNLTDNTQDSTLTDSNGSFSFNGLYYGKTGQFVLSAFYPLDSSHVFIHSPITLTLTEANPQLTGVVVLDSTGFAADSANTGFTLTNFTATPIASGDKVLLSCNYTLTFGDTLRLNVMRDNALIYIQTIVGGSSFTYEDLSGKPGFVYDYAVSLYKLQGNTVKVLKRERNDVAFPVVKSPSGFAATVSSALGVVNLSWTHTSLNYSGFRIYRSVGPLPSDTVLLAELAPNTFAFTDKQTLPGSNGYNYVLRSKRTVENLTFESQNVVSGLISYPSLPSLSGLTATANTSRNSVLLTWTVPGASPLNDTSFNFDGYLIYRKRNSNNVTQLVGKTYKHFARTFEDKSGVPGVAYTYSVKAFVNLKSPYTLADTAIVSAQVNKSVTYPILKAPSNFSRTNNINNVTLNWTPAVNQSGSARNFDGQTVYFRIGTGPMDSVDLPLSVNSYVYYTNVTSATPINFAVRSYKIINGVKYVSNPVGGLGFATGINSSTLPIPPQFRASQDLPEHIRLTWNYPVYIYASFKVYRNGALLAILPTGSREYYDYTAENFLTYLYEIEAVYEENTTLKASALGKRNTLSSLQGRVYAQGSKYGLPFIEVTASASGYFARTFTDTSGYYTIDQLPVQSSLPVTVTVDGGNTVFTGTSGAYPSTKSFTVEGERYKMYELDFVSNYSPLSKDTSRLSVPEYVYAKADPERKRMVISWTPGNQLHDGFLVYRANTLIASVTKNEALIVYDTEGSQGVNYLYQVFAYKESASGKITGNPGITYGTFPKVEPVIYLSAFPDIERNSVNITWSHAFANHSRYEIRRNGDLVSSISTLSPTIYIDTLGVPGALYNYSVTAVDETSNSFVESQSATTQANFPLLSEVTDLTISIPDTMLSCSTAIGRNHVWLQWDYASRCTGFLVYRNNQLIKILSSKEYMYRDTSGIPGLNTDYVVKAYLNINNTNYSSDGQTINTQYPVVAAPFGLNYVTDNGFVNLQWNYSEKIAHSFEIWRFSTTPLASQSIFTLKTDSLGNNTGNFSFVDETGFMGRNYTYKVRTVALRNGIFYNSDFSPCTPSAIMYPNIPAPIVPTGLTVTDVASDGTYANYVFLQWEYEGNNIDGFFLYKNGSLIASVGKGMRNYRHIANQTGVLNYEVKAWKLADDNGSPDTVISLPLADNGNIGQGVLGTLSPLIATQGTLSQQVQLNWTTGGSYTIYRDDIQIGTVTGTTYTDNTAIPGKHYIYEVSPNNPANRTPVEGWAKYNGYISGFAYQLGTSVGLGGVLVEASATFEGNTWYFADTTDNSGGYAIEDIYYGSESRTFEVKAKLEQCGVKHAFLINPQSCILSEFVPEVIQNNFYDKTTYKIKGTIRRKYTSCGLDSIRVWAEYEFANGSTLTTVTDAYTNRSGQYSLNINLAQLGLVRIRLMVDSVRNLSNGDSIVYRFVSLGANEWSGNALTCMDLVTTVDYEEILTFPVKISLVNGCGTPLTGGKYVVQAQSSDLCYDRTFTVNQTTGEVVADLPPMPLSIRVSGVENLNTTTLDVLEYLKYRPVVQPLDSFASVIHPEIGANLPTWEEGTHTFLVYHRPPVLRFKTDPFSRYLCNDPDRAGIISQGEDYVMDIQVLETFDTECEITNGYLNIRNSGATVTDTILRYDSEVGFRYLFTAGNPNLVSPYQHICYMAFYSNSGELLAEKSLTILVEGSAQLPGSDIILDITGEGEDNTVPIPLYVLRDPPGDGSTSKIEKGSTVSKKISLEREVGGGAGLFSEGELAFASFGLLWDVNVMAGRNDAKGVSFEVKTTTKEEISTDGGPIYVGVNGDVIVGMGMAFQYGLTKQISVAEDNCIIHDKTELGIAPNGVKTQWMYTIKHINALIYEYEQRRDRGDRIQQGGQLWSLEDSKAFFQTKVDNWNSILGYHQEETLPHYNLCAKKFENLVYNSDPLSNQLASQIEERTLTFNEWQAGFCNEIGKYENGKFSLDEEITWNQALIDKYNVAETVLRNLANLDYNPQGYDWQFSAANLANTQKYLDTQFDALHGIAAENLTFSAGLAYSKSIESAKASSHSLKGSTFFNLEGKIGINVSQHTDFSFDPVTNVVSSEVGKVDIKIGLQAKLDINISEEYEKAEEEVNTVSYELTDDDETDQFSVTVIQGIEPNQTPYFSLLGGRSTCPDEEGTILSDDPRINILKDGGATKYDLIENVNPEGTAKIMIQISSLNPFHSTRDITLTNILSTNPGGASIKMGGNPLTNYTFYNVSPDEPIVMELTVSRGPNEYDYDNMQIAVIPTCYSDPEITYTATNGDTITFSVHFSNPCSDIALASPEDNWVIQRRNLSATNNQEALPIKVAGFDVDNPEFRSIRFEYRRTGVNNEWIPIEGSVISRDSLAIYQALHVFPGEVPYYWFIWDITDDFDRYPNGNYEVRATAECMIDGKQVYSYTRPSSGTIDRNMQLLGLPEPSDQIWTYGDEIAIRFMTDIQCNRIDSANFILRNKNELVGGNYTLIPGKIYCQDNRLRFIPDAPMKTFDGDTLEFTVSGVYSVTGEIMNDQTWNFAVSARDLYMDKTKFDVQVYQGESITVYSNFYNKKPTGNLTYSILGLTPSGTNDGTYANWLTARNSRNITLVAGGSQTVYFDLSAANLEPGYYQVSLDVQDSISRVYTDALTFEMQVLPKASGWSVNPALYENSMSVMANYRFTNPILLNTDTTDLISVWMGNEIRGVGKIEKVGVNVLAAINVFGNAGENGKPLRFRVWDSETGNEYDAFPASPRTYQADGSLGMITNPLLLSVNQVEDKARYIALAEGWNLFSLNTSKANDSLNTVLSGLRHPHNGDVVKTASKSATYSTVSNTWVTANGLYTMSFYNGYQLYLSQSDTLRITGTISGTLNRDSLFNGWNLIGVPLAAPASIHTVLAGSKFLLTAQPDSMQLKTTALPGYDYQNMMAFYKPSQNPDWLFTVSSGMDEIRPTFGYRLKVNKNTSLCMGTACSGTTSLRTGVNLPVSFDLFDTETWKVNPSAYEYNMLITAYVEIDDEMLTGEGVKVAAYVGNECRGTGELVYVPEYNRYLISLFVYANMEGEEIHYRIFAPQKGRYYDHFEAMLFENDGIVGGFDMPYRMSNSLPGNTFTVAAYPNPFQYKLTIELVSDVEQDFAIHITDLMGKVVGGYSLSEAGTSHTLELKFNPEDWMQGVYLLHIKGSLGEQKAIKIIYNP